jgi:hypothetical protein
MASGNESIRHVLQELWTGHFGHQYRIGPGLGDGIEIIEPPRRIESVDADNGFAHAEPARGEGLQDLAARRCLRLRRNGVFEIEDDGVDRQRPRLLDRARVRSRHVKRTPARADGHFSFSR